MALKHKYNILTMDNYHKKIKKLKDTLEETKNKIDNVPKEWDIVKKMIHEHEYVYTSYNSNNNIAFKRPISRSYFKLIEILNKYNIELNKEALCLAEAPGGFIHCIMDRYKYNKIYGITLLSEDNMVPKWNGKIYKNNKVELVYGINKDGNMYNISNIISFVKEMGRNRINLITGDGGIDYSKDYNMQEINSVHIIYSEILIALLIQSEGGNFICKLFDIFDIKTIRLVYILKKCYRNVDIYKPCISRLTNSEKYIVCRGYKVEEGKKLVNKMLINFNEKTFDINISEEFMDELYDMNLYYINKQIKSINQGINIINNNKLIKTPSELQINKGIVWCNENGFKIRNRRR